MTDLINKIIKDESYILKFNDRL